MSASGRFGSRQREKRDLAAEIAALLAFSAIKNNDRVGLIIFTDEVEHFVPPKKGKHHVLRVVSEILSFSAEAAGAPTLAVGLEFLGRVARRRAVAFLISDFLAPVASYERALRIASRRHDLVPVSVSDPLEEAIPNVGFIELLRPGDGRHGAVRHQRARGGGVQPRGARGGGGAQGAVQAAGHGRDRRQHRPPLPARADRLLRGARR